MSSSPSRSDMEALYEIVNNQLAEDNAIWADDPDDGEFFVDAEDGIEIDEDDVDDDGEDEDYEDDEEDDDDEPPQYLTSAELGEDDDDDEDGGDTEDVQSPNQWLELAALLNGTTGTHRARSALLSRLLAISPQSTNRSGLLRTTGPVPSAINIAERRRAATERARKVKWYEPQKVADPRGIELLKSGDFGPVGDWRLPGKWRRPRAIESERRRRRGWIPPIAKATIPNTHGTVVAAYPSIPYVGQYAGPDYGVFYTATQYFTLHLYSTQQPKITARRTRNVAASPVQSAPARLRSPDEDDDDYPTFGMGRGGTRSEDTSLKKIKTVQGVEGSWTITDADCDQKGEKMIYSSITPYVHMLFTSQDDTHHVQFDFSSSNQTRSWGYDRFGIWSIRFSADGKEVVAGAGGGKIMVYDIEAQSRSLSVNGHHDDVNAVCFADESSTNILVSGSDDGYVKVWDRRSLSSSTPSGVLVGATEGITYTSPKGDGRYIVVNSKDQAARLYDLRKMRSHSEFEGEPDAVSKYGSPSYDYRNSHYPRPKLLAHPKDCSVMTYRGHSVLRTLIRCHFSPIESTGQSYIYSGSADGMIHIWSLDGRVVQVLNRAESIPLRTSSGSYSDPSAPETPQNPASRRRGAEAYDSYGMNYTVRDVAWHGFEPTLMSTCWEVEGGYRRGGSLGRHEFKGLGKGGMRKMEDWVEKQLAEARESR